MSEPLLFDRDLYPRDVIALVARKFERKARVELSDDGPVILAELHAIAQDEDEQRLRDDFSTEAFSAMTQRLRDTGTSADAVAESSPPWPLLSPFHAGADLGGGWVLESLSPIRCGAAAMELRHDRLGTRQVAIRRNGGSPIGLAYTDHLDFLLMNNGGGSSPTEGFVADVLIGMAQTIRRQDAPAAQALAHLSPLDARASGQPSAPDTAKSVAIRSEAETGTIRLEVDALAAPRLGVFDALLGFAERCHIRMHRLDSGRVELRLKLKEPAAPDTLAALARDVDAALTRAGDRKAGATRAASDAHAGLPPLLRPPVDVEALVRELAAGDIATLGIGFQPERGPAHTGMGVLNILGTGACNSDCLFCCEKFHENNRPTPNADATRQLILSSSDRFDMLFFASGEPTIHPKLFDYVELAKSVGFKSFGMSSHFRTFADPRFALRTLQAGFQYFDISLHAADVDSQLDVNPIEDGGASLFEALTGLAILYRLSDALGIRITVTHKIVISRLNVTQLEAIFRATYDRGVRNFILQPVRATGLSAERQEALAISEAEILPYLNDLLRRTAGLGAVLKPYGFSRAALVSGAHVESERNRVKNISGKSRAPRGHLLFPQQQEQRPADGRHWVEIQAWPDERFGFAVDGTGVVLDEGLQRGALLPFGCRMGSCGMCCAKLLAGKVDQSTQIFLSQEQIEQGYVLLCQARPLSDVTVRLCSDDEIDPL